MYQHRAGRLSQDEPDADRTYVLLATLATEMSGGTRRYIRLGKPTTGDLSKASRFTREHAEMFAGTNPNIVPRLAAEEATAVSPTFVLVCTLDEAHLHRAGCADVARTELLSAGATTLPLEALDLPAAEEEAKTADWDEETGPLIVVKPCARI